MIPINTAVGIGVGTLMVVALIVTVMTGSIFAAGVVLALILLMIVVLVQYKILTVKVSGDQVDVFLFEPSPEPTPTPLPNHSVPRPVSGKEVFHISDSKFVYDEAPAVCAAYGADLATQEQVEEAFQKGAEWCGYGWSAGGVALYPTQKSTWDQLQREVDPAKRTACGRPGVNGGYFDPTLKFGVNCYGTKPKGDAKLPLPPPGTDASAFRKQVDIFKNQISSFVLNPFNRSTWSSYGSGFTQDLGALMTTPDASVIKAPPSILPGAGAASPSSSSSLIFKATEAP